MFELKFELTSIYKQIHANTHTHPYALTESLETHSQVRKDVDGSRKHMMEVDFLIQLQSHLNGIKEILKYLDIPPQALKLDPSRVWLRNNVWKF